MNPEAAHYLARIEDLRGQIGALVEELPAEGLNWRPIEGEADHAVNSIAVLAAHAAGAETFWLHEVIGKRPKQRDREKEFETQVEGPEELLAVLKGTGEITRQILENLDADDLAASRVVDGKEVAVRWGILHVIDHTALHLGHMQITYQLWNRGKGIDSPRWFQRV